MPSVIKLCSHPLLPFHSPSFGNTIIDRGQPVNHTDVIVPTRLTYTDTTPEPAGTPATFYGGRPAARIRPLNAPLPE